MAENRLIVGTEFKVMINIEPFDGVHMEEMEFECAFYTRINEPLVVRKSEMIKIDADNYIALVNTEDMNPGTLRNRMIVDIPDRDFADGYRREIVDMVTDMKVSK